MIQSAEKILRWVNEYIEQLSVDRKPDTLYAPVNLSLIHILNVVALLPFTVVFTYPSPAVA